jgi:Asp/Glu/hydantoin racemase
MITQADRDEEANAYQIRCFDDPDVIKVVAMIRAGVLDMWTSIQERAAARAHLLGERRDG